MMKFLYKLFSLCLISVLLTGCLGDGPTDTTSEWKEKNDKWMLAKSLETDEQGNPVYERVTCTWDPNAYVLMRWHNDRSETASALCPLSTSTIDVRYEVRTIDSVMVDNSHSRVTPAPGIYRSQLNQNINGWIVGIGNMHVGDTCTILIPYNQAYGPMQYNSLKPYSSLIFNVRLTGVPAFEKPI